MVVDFYTPFLPALLPLLIQRLDISMTLASILASILTFSSALAQPVFGILADRIGGKKLIFLGPIAAAIGLSFIGLMPSYGLLVMFLILGGLGSACFHPQAAALAGHFSGPRRGFGISLFMLGGNVGYGFGPMLILAIVLGLGMSRSYVALLPAVIFAFILVRYLPDSVIPRPAEQNDRAVGRGIRSGDLVSFSILWLVVWLRSTAILSLSTFLPTFQILHGFSLAAGGGAFTILILAGAVGGFVGGMLSDRIGRKWVVIVSLITGIPAFYLFLYLPGRWTFVSLAVLGFLLFSGESPCVVMAQEMFPGKGGTMSSLIMGFAWGMAGVGLLGTGMLADAFGMDQAMRFLPYLPTAALILAFFLPGKTVLSYSDL